MAERSAGAFVGLAAVDVSLEAAGGGAVVVLDTVDADGFSFLSPTGDGDVMKPIT